MGFVALQRSVGSSSKTFVLVQVMSTLTHFAHLHQQASPPRPGLGGGPRMDGPQVGQEGWSASHSAGNSIRGSLLGLPLGAEAHPHSQF